MSIQYESDQRTVQDIVNLYEKKQLNLNPGFQRSSVWTDRDRSKLIDSILRGYALPSIFFYRHYEDGNVVYDVIDGKQRIESILLFIGAMWGNKFWTKSRLPDQEHDDWINWLMIKRKKLQHKITGYRLQTVEVTGDLGEIIDLFVRINSTGKALTGAEKRHAKYYKSQFLKKAGQLARRYQRYFNAARILGKSQIARMKHVELICELMVSASVEGIINKKAALDKVMEAGSISGHKLQRTAALTVTSLNRIQRMFPLLKQTRFKQMSDFYSLAVVIQKFEREGMILTDRKRNLLAQDILIAFSNGVDEVSRLQKQARGPRPEQELYREYLLTVREGTDEISHRRKRGEILRGLLESLFERKDSERLFSAEQRRLLWNSSDQRRCAACRTLTWEDFTIDHINPYSKGGRTQLDNAALMCRKHNSAKGNRGRRLAA
jgi:5-methylcytosine-specific restriction endonuclease McrA